MFCPNCGAQNPDGTPKCTTCGQVLQSAGARPQAKFKGTMLMTNDAAPPSPRGPGAPPPGAKGQFAKTMMGGMASLDPASLGGGGMIAAHDDNHTMFAGPGGQGNQVEAARTVAMDASAFGLGPTPAAGPVASPFAPHAPARPTAPAAPEPAASTNEEDMGVASTIAVDGSSFGFDAQSFPGPGPGSSSFGQSAPQHQAPQAQAPQPPAPQPQPPVHQQAPASSTVAMDASAFGLGGPGAPGMPGGFGQQPPQGGFGQQQPPQGGGFGQQPQGGFGQAQPGGPQGPGPGGPGGFGAPPHNESSGISSTVAVDASAFGLGGMGGPGMPGQYGQQPGMPPQGQYGQQPGMQPPQGQYGMQPGMQPPQGQYGMQPPGQYGMQPPQGQYGQPPAAPAKGGSKAGLIIGIVFFLLLVAGGIVAVLMRRS